MCKKGRILITGATGYIGSHTVVELIKAGYDVVGVDNFSNSTPDVLNGLEKILGKRIPFVEADCCNSFSFGRVFEQYNDIVAAVHFAAFKAVGESVHRPVEYFENNLISLLNLIKFMGAKNSAAIVFSSSCTVYGEPSDNDLPITEDAPTKPATSPYGRTKQISEDILRDCVVAFPHLKVVALRYFNPIGAHPSALIGELPNGVPQNLVPYIVQTASGLRKELMIFGNDYDTPDGTCIRDYIYVCDLAKAHVAAVSRMLEDADAEQFETYNIGTGSGMSVLELVKTFIKSTGVDFNYRFAPRRDGDVVKIWADPHKANEFLKWSATTPIEEILNSAWGWEKYLRGI